MAGPVRSFMRGKSQSSVRIQKVGSKGCTKRSMSDHERMEELGIWVREESCYIDVGAEPAMSQQNSVMETKLQW